MRSAIGYAPGPALHDAAQEFAQKRAREARNQKDTEIRVFAFEAAGLLWGDTDIATRMRMAIRIADFVTPHWDTALKEAAKSAAKAACAHPVGDSIALAERLLEFFSTGSTEKAPTR